MKQNNTIVVALAQALGIGVYVFIIALIMRNGQVLFGKMDTLTGPIVFLLLFVVSAAITGSLILARPAMLYFDNRKSEAVHLFLYTLGWLVLMIVIILITLSMR